MQVQNFSRVRNQKGYLIFTPNTSVILLFKYKWHLNEGKRIILDWRIKKLPQQLMTCYKTDNI